MIFEVIQFNVEAMIFLINKSYNDGIMCEFC